jgi:hypothetical protein
MNRKIINAIALGVVLLGATSVSLAKGQMSLRAMSATCESTDGTAKCSCKGDCTADTASCHCA